MRVLKPWPSLEGGLDEIRELRPMRSCRLASSGSQGGDQLTHLFIHLGTPEKVKSTAAQLVSVIESR
jgi:hypothetical protein